MKRLALCLAWFTACFAISFIGLSRAGATERAEAPCDHWSVKVLSHSTDGGRYAVRFHVQRPCSVELVSFTATSDHYCNDKPDHCNGPGKVYDRDVIRAPEGGDYDGHVDLPDCYYQADTAVAGRVIHSATGGKNKCRPPPSTTLPPTTTSTSSAPTTMTTPPTTTTSTSTPTTSAPPSPPTSAPPSSTTSPPTPPCEAGLTTSGPAGSPTDTCELAQSGIGDLAPWGVGAVTFGLVALAEAHRRRVNLDATRSG